MLSAAHVLAMDAKNLLDVVDSIRIRHPELFVIEGSKKLHSNELLSNEINDSSETLISSINDNDAWSPTQTYQNVNISIDGSKPSSVPEKELYVNQEQLQAIKNLEELYNTESTSSSKQNDTNFDQNAIESFTVCDNDQSSSSKISPLTKPPVAVSSGK